MILVGTYRSPFVRRVAVSLRVLDIPYRLEALSSRTDREALRRINPLGRVPALILDDGEVLIDSNAILDHLDAEVGPGRALVPPAGAERRRVLRLLAFSHGALEKTLAAFYGREMVPEEKRHEPWLARCEEQARAGLAGLDEAVAEPWFLGARLTQADITAACARAFIGRALPHLLAADAYPSLAALAARCEALPAFAETRVPAR